MAKAAVLKRILLRVVFLKRILLRVAVLKRILLRVAVLKRMIIMEQTSVMSILMMIMGLAVMALKSTKTIEMSLSTIQSLTVVYQNLNACGDTA